MPETDTKQSSVHRIISEVKKYLILQRDLLKIEGVEKLTILVTAFLLLMLFVILGTAALFYFLFAFAYILAPHVGGLTVSFLIIGCIPLLLLIISFFFRKQLIINPIVRFLAGLFLIDSDKQNSEQ